MTEPVSVSPVLPPEAVKAAEEAFEIVWPLCGVSDGLDEALEAAAPLIAAAERERIASAVPAATLDGLADWMTRIRAEFDGPAAVPDLPARLKRLASLLRTPDAEA